MSVELDPKSADCYCMGLANGTLFTVCNGPLIDIVGEQRSNDPMDVSAADAKQCAAALAEWEPPSGWFSEGKEQEGKNKLIKFFRECDGFTTR